MELIELENKLKIMYREDYQKKVIYELKELIDCCKFNYAIIKGFPLSQMAYNQPFLRACNDIDFLLSRSKIKNMENILSKMDYIQPNASMDYKKDRNNKILLLSSSHQLLSYVNMFDNFYVVVDLNFDVFWGEYEGKRIDIEEFLSDTIEMEIYGVKVKTLPPIKAMIQLVLHHYKDMNSIFLLATRKSIKYDMFKDVYYLLKNNLDTIPLDKLYDMSAEYEIIPYVFYVLYYTGQVFDDEILKQYIETFRTPEGEALLNCYGLCAKERKEWKCDFKTRLDADNLYDLIKDDLTEKDREKIAINKRIFMGVSE